MLTSHLNIDANRYIEFVNDKNTKRMKTYYIDGVQDATIAQVMNLLNEMNTHVGSATTNASGIDFLFHEWHIDHDNSFVGFAPHRGANIVIRWTNDASRERIDINIEYGFQHWGDDEPLKFMMSIANGGHFPVADDASSERMRMMMNFEYASYMSKHNATFDATFKRACEECDLVYDEQQVEKGK